MSAMSLKELEHLKKRGAILKHIQDQIPNFKIVQKEDSFLMKTLSFFLFFNKRFMTNYITTIYPNIYVPRWWGRRSKKWNSVELETLAHEYVHLYDRKRLGWLFNVLYLSPQIFALLAFGAIWNPWWLLCLLFLLPLPSLGRTWLEFRAYKIGLLTRYWILCSYKNKTEEKYWNFINNEGVNWVVKQFSSSAYYYMFPFENFLRKRFIKSLENVRINNELSSEMDKVRNILLG
tara:strand:+ start:824 stop:1522 length:699 start_codon:yes stop_codon:yes gene_type:complete